MSPIILIKSILFVNESETSTTLRKYLKERTKFIKIMFVSFV